MPDREAYRKKAQECVASAESMRDPVERAAMLQIAHGYMTLADHLGDHLDNQHDLAPNKDESISGGG